MRSVVAFLLSLILCGPLLGGEFPTVNPPYKYRQWNYVRSGPFNGSCCFASVITLLKWQGQHQLARSVYRRFHGGQVPWTLDTSLDKVGVRFASTWGHNDVGFLAWSVRTRRGAAVAINGGRHMVCLVHLDKNWAGLIDNNDPRKVRWRKTPDFLLEWKDAGSWAVTPVYTPLPPLPPEKRR